MQNGLIDTAAKATTPDDRRIYGVVVAEVTENCDKTMRGRVRVRFSWLPGYEPWARVAAAMAGEDRGAYVMPRAGDEVLVVFNHGDVREPYVIGSLLNGNSKPPVTAPDDADTKWVIRMSKDHEIVFDDAARSIRIKAGTRQVTLTDQQIELSVDDNKATSITLDTRGNITIKAEQTLTLEARSIELRGTDKVVIKGNPLDISGGSQCTIDATQIYIG